MAKSKGFSLNITDILGYLPAIQKLIDGEKALQKAKTSKAKRAAVGGLFLDLIGAAAIPVAKNNQKYSKLIDEFQSFASSAVDQFASSTAIQPSTGTPATPLPAGTDPTTTLYDTLDAAKAAYTALPGGGSGYHIDLRKDSKYQIWPNGVSPEPGTPVWP